jgi:hypothetical protein
MAFVCSPGVGVPSCQYDLTRHAHAWVVSADCDGEKRKQANIEGNCTGVPRRHTYASGFTRLNVSLADPRMRCRSWRGA